MIYDIIAGFLSGVLSAMGFGGGSILILYLTMYKNVPQLKAQGINLVFFIPTAILALTLHHKKNLIDRKNALKLIGFGIIGLTCGYVLIKLIPENIVSKIFSVILIGVGVKEILPKNKK